MSKQYSQGFKASIVQKMLLPGAPSASQLSKELGISQTSLSRWAREYGKNAPMSKRKKNPPHSWPAEKKLQAVIETSSMSEQELGDYLRKQGLHSSDLKEWKEQCMSGFKGAGRPRKDPEVRDLRKANKELEKDARRKDKALAEMSARIVLLKKSRLIWGDSEDDE